MKCRIKCIKPSLIASLILILFLVTGLTFALPSIPNSFATNQGKTNVPPGCSGYACAQGIADYGVTPVTFKNYTYNSYSVMAKITFTSVNLTFAGRNQFWLQLDAVAYNMLELSSYGQYWAQDVVNITEWGKTPASSTPLVNNFSAQFFDNIWNYTRDPYTGATMAGLVYGCGATYSGLPYYGCVDRTTIYNLKLPFTIVLKETASINTKVPFHRSQLTFSYQVLEGTKSVSSKTFDTVSFASSFSVKKTPYFHVGGTNGYPCGSCLSGNGFDINALQILVTSIAGENYALPNLSATFKLYYHSTTKKSWLVVPHAWSEGETGEVISGVLMTANVVGTATATYTTGNNQNIPLW